LSRAGEPFSDEFEGFAGNVALPAERFHFVPPPGTDVAEQR